MIPLMLAVAFGAAKLNEQSFYRYSAKWKHLREFDTICSKIDRFWITNQMKVNSAFGVSRLDRANLIGKFRALHNERAASLQKLIALQCELPLIYSPIKIIAKAKECWALRSACQSLSCEINSAPFRASHYCLLSRCILG